MKKENEFTLNFKPTLLRILDLVSEGKIITASEKIKKLAIALDAVGYGKTIDELKIIKL